MKIPWARIVGLAGVHVEVEAAILHLLIGTSPSDEGIGNYAYVSDAAPLGTADFRCIVKKVAAIVL